jgi:hypothetical protein
MSSKRPENSTPTGPETISRDQHAALFALINKSRLAQGWNALDIRSADPVIRVWADELNRYRIPIECYPELYNRAFDVRMNALSHGKDAPMIDAVLLASRWSGEHGLAAEIARKKRDQQKSLQSSLLPQDPVCPRCRDTNVEIIYRPDGSKAGGKPGCKHVPLEEGEWLYREEQRLANVGQTLINQARGGTARIIDLPARANHQ